MNRSNLERLAPLTGILFVAILVASLIIAGNTSDVDDSTESVLKFWSDNDSSQIVSAILGGLAAIPLVWFAGTLRERLNAGPGADRLATISFGGFVLLAAGGTANAAIQFSAADSVGDVPAAVTQTLSVLYSDFFFPIAAGVIIAMLASGVAILRTNTFPRWLGWAGVAIGIVFIPAWFAGGPLAAIWVVIASVLMYRGTPVADRPATAQPTL